MTVGNHPFRRVEDGGEYVLGQAARAQPMSMSNWSFEQEAVKAALSAVVAIVSLGLGWLIGQRLSAMWALRQKRRELDLTSAAEFSRLYGEFFAVWKLWNYCSRSRASEETEDRVWSLMQRAAAMEASFEALLVKVCSERELSRQSLEDLGLLRQGFQHLRECIRDEKAVAWSYSEHPQYSTFKHLACVFANLLASDREWKIPTSSAAASSLKEITSNKHEIKWDELIGKRAA